MKKTLFVLFIGILSLVSSDLWAPYECASCGPSEKLRACMDAVRSEKFVIQGRANPESAQRVINALRNKLDDLSAALESINERSTREDFQAYNDARGDFEHLVKIVDKQQDAGEWILDDTTDKILDVCDDALQSELVKKN